MHISLFSSLFSTGRAVDLECVRHAEGRTNMPTSSTSFCLLCSLSLSLSLSLTYRVILVNPDLFHAAWSSSQHICGSKQIWDLLLDCSALNARLYSWISAPSLGIYKYHSRKPERTKRASTHKNMRCTRNYVRAVCVFMHPHTFQGRVCRSVLPVAESSCCSGQQIPSCLLIRAGKCEHVLVRAVETASNKERKWGCCVKWLINWLLCSTLTVKVELFMTFQKQWAQEMRLDGHSEQRYETPW